MTATDTATEAKAATGTTGVEPPFPTAADDISGNAAQQTTWDKSWRPEYTQLICVASLWSAAGDEERGIVSKVINLKQFSSGDVATDPFVDTSLIPQGAEISIFPHIASATRAVVSAPRHSEATLPSASLSSSSPRPGFSDREHAPPSASSSMASFSSSLSNTPSMISAQPIRSSQTSPSTHDHPTRQYEHETFHTSPAAQSRSSPSSLPSLLEPFPLPAGPAAQPPPHHGGLSLSSSSSSSTSVGGGGLPSGSSSAAPTTPMSMGDLGPGARTFQMLVGTSAVPCLLLNDVDGSEGVFFVFNDLSVRMKGFYRLKFQVVDASTRDRSDVLAEAWTDPFEVFPPKMFPGMKASTRLSRVFADQGIAIHIRTSRAEAALRGSYAFAQPNPPAAAATAATPQPSQAGTDPDPASLPPFSS